MASGVSVLVVGSRFSEILLVVTGIPYVGSLDVFFEGLIDPILKIYHVCL